jgi:hypothetical protein
VTAVTAKKLRFQAGGIIAGADTMRSGSLCRLASMAAHSVASNDSSDPSTPTTTGLLAIAGLLNTARVQRENTARVQRENTARVQREPDGQCTAAA